MKNTVERHYRMYPFFDEEEGFVPERKIPLDIDVVFKLYDDGDYDKMAVVKVTVDGKTIYDAKASEPGNVGSTRPLTDALIALGYDFNPGGWLDEKERCESHILAKLRAIKWRKKSIWPVLAKVPDNIIPFAEKTNWARHLDFAWMLGNDSDPRIRDVVVEEIKKAIEEGEDFVDRMKRELKSCHHPESEKEVIQDAKNRINGLIYDLNSAASWIEESQKDTERYPFNVNLERYELVSVTDSDRVMARLALFDDLMSQEMETSEKVDSVQFHVTEPLRHLLANKPKLGEDVRRRLIETITTNEFLNENFHQWAVETLGYLGHDGKSCQWMMDSLQRASRQYSPRGYIDEIYSMVVRLGEITPPSDRQTVLDFLDRLESDISRKSEEDGTPSAIHEYEKLKVALLQARHDLGNLDAVRNALWDEKDHYGIRSLAIRLYADSPDVPDNEKRAVLKRIFTQVFEESMRLVESDKLFPLNQEYWIDPIAEWFSKHGDESDLRYFMDRAKEGKAFLERTGKMPLNSESMLSFVGGVSLMVARVKPELTPSMRQAIQSFKVFKRQVREYEDATLHGLQHYKAMDEIDMYAPRFLSYLIHLENQRGQEVFFEPDPIDRWIQSGHSRRQSKGMKL